MNFLSLLALALALAMDAFAVSVATGIELGQVRKSQALRMAGAFGFFQAAMPVIGWALGLTVRDFIENWDHWIAFALLAWIGVNMIRESFGKEESSDDLKDPTKGFTLLLLAIATSIDALAVGLSFALLDVSIWQPALLIGVICFAVTIAGIFLGKTLSNAEIFGKRAELAGGLVLVGIGLKILAEHGVFSFLLG